MHIQAPAYLLFGHVTSPAMAASLLEDNLRFLQLCLTGDAAQKEQSIAIIADLNQICVQEITDKDIGK